MARAYVSSRAVVFVLTLLAFLYVDFEYLQMHPSPGLIAYINRITGVVTSATPPPQARPTMTAAEIEQAHQKLPKGLGDGGGGRAATHSVEGALGPAGRPGHDGGRHLTMKRHFDAAPQGAATALESPPSDATPAEVASEASPQPNYRLVRFNAKSHMAFPIDLFLDYSTARWLAVDVGIANIPFVTANLISAIHPLVAFFAAYLIVKAASSGKNPGQGSTGASAPIELSHIAAPHSPVAGAHTGPGVSPSNHTGEATPKINTTAAMVAAAAAATVIEDETKPLVDRRAARQMSAVNIAEADDAEKDKDWTQLFASVNQRSLRVAAALVLLRNILDTMDGIVARTQRANAIARGIHLPPAVTTVGFNGHTMDMVTDTLGCVAVGFAVHYVICTKTLTWHRIPAAIFKRIAPRLVGNRNQFIVKVIAWFGLSYIAVASSTWETFMIRYSNLFDVHANTNTDIFLLESNWHVRMTQMLWSLSCGDAMIFAVIIMLFFNKMWEGAQLMLLVGFPWQALLMGYSFWVWQNVILANATAAKIVLANPELFP